MRENGDPVVETGLFKRIDHAVSKKKALVRCGEGIAVGKP